MHQGTNLNKLRRGRSIESNGRRESMENIQLRRSNSPVCRRREQRLTRISLTIVWLFLFCQFWKLVPTVYELIYGDDVWPDWAHFVKHLSHALIVLNSSVNFLIYLLLWTKEASLKYFQPLKREPIFSKLWSKMQKDSISIISISFSKSEITFKTIECTLMYFDMMLSGENSLADWILMWLACQKKSYLICDKITNFRIFTQPFFHSAKLRQPKQSRDSCLKKKKYYIIFRKFVISSHIR